MRAMRPSQILCDVRRIFSVYIDEGLCSGGAYPEFHIYFRKEDYSKAEEYLNFFPENHPDRELLQAHIYAKTGKSEEAYSAYEGLMLSDANRLRCVVNALQVYCLEENNLELPLRYTLSQEQQ